MTDSQKRRARILVKLEDRGYEFIGHKQEMKVLFRNGIQKNRKSKNTKIRNQIGQKYKTRKNVCCKDRSIDDRLFE